MGTNDPLAPVYPPEVPPGPPQPPRHHLPPNGRPWMYALVLLAVLGVSILFLRDRTSSPAPLERAPTTVEPVDQARPAQPLDTARVFSGDTMRTTVR